MADVTVKELADVVGTSAERLLAQMKDAGLPQTSADQKVSDDQKQALLLHLKKSHGDAAVTPNKITLKRKVTTTLKTGQGGKKAVAIEVRKKRTYMKREELDQEAEKAAAEEAARLEAEAQAAAAAAAPAPAAEPVVEAVAAGADDERPKPAAKAAPVSVEEDAAQKRAEAEAAAARQEEGRKKTNKAVDKKRVDQREDSRFRDDDDNRG